MLDERHLILCPFVLDDTHYGCQWSKVEMERVSRESLGSVSFSFR